jgi:TrpR-related protein YerC/YecD
MLEYKKTLVLFQRKGGLTMIKKPPREPSMALYEEIVSLKDVESCYRFFQDLCSITELRSMEQRFDVAKLLDEGKVYTEIVEQTGASSATISRVNRALKYGENGLLDAFHRQDEPA